MKKLILIFLMLFIGYAYADDVEFNEIENETENDGGPYDPFSGQVKIPNKLKSSRSSVAIHGNIIYFKTPCENCTLYVYNEDGDLEYMTAIPDGTVTFALHFSGEYKVVVTDGLFYCEKNVSL
ncbi:MAG: hypothetical protein K5757_07895 [Bacteroidaceae bacterium]|nr:hypothetical protein [Bacteroidaceae bacterium]